MTRLPRDLGGEDLAHGLSKLGYVIVRQSGSHIRITTSRGGEHHVTIPNHRPLRVGTLAAIIAEIGAHHRLSRDELIALISS